MTGAECPLEFFGSILKDGNWNIRVGVPEYVGYVVVCHASAVPSDLPFSGLFHLGLESPLFPDQSPDSDRM